MDKVIHKKIDTPLSCKLVGDEVVIKIGIGTLAFAYEISEYNNPWSDDTNDTVQQCMVVNKKEFAKDVIAELISEREDGSTLITDMFDKAEQNAMENGSEGIEDNEY